MRRNGSSYSNHRSMSRMNKTFNVAIEDYSRPDSKYTHKSKQVRKVPSLGPVKTKEIYQFDKFEKDDEVLQALHTKSNRGRHCRNSATNSSINSGGRVSGNHFYTPKGGINFPLTYYSEAAQKSQKVTKMMRKMKRSKRDIGYHNTSGQTIEEDGGESITTTCKKKK